MYDADNTSSQQRPTSKSFIFCHLAFPTTLIQVINALLVPMQRCISTASPRNSISASTSTSERRWRSSSAAPRAASGFCPSRGTATRPPTAPTPMYRRRTQRSAPPPPPPNRCVSRNCSTLYRDGSRIHTAAGLLIRIGSICPVNSSKALRYSIVASCRGLISGEWKVVVDGRVVFLDLWRQRHTRQCTVHSARCMVWCGE